jgi:hypothetical protein
MLSRYQNAAAASREYAERFPERHHPGPRQLLTYINKLITDVVDYYRDIFLTLNIAHTYSLCSVLKNTGQCMYVIT